MIALQLLFIVVNILFAVNFSTQITTVQQISTSNKKSYKRDLIVLGMVDGSISILDADTGIELLKSGTGGAMLQAGSQCGHNELLVNEGFDVSTSVQGGEIVNTQVAELQKMKSSLSKIIPGIDGSLWSVLNSDNMEINKLLFSVQEVIESEIPVEIDSNNLFGSISGKALLTGSKSTSVFSLKYNPFALSDEEQYILMKERSTPLDPNVGREHEPLLYISRVENSVKCLDAYTHLHLWNVSVSTFVATIPNSFLAKNIPYASSSDVYFSVTQGGREITAKSNTRYILHSNGDLKLLFDSTESGGATQKNKKKEKRGQQQQIETIQDNENDLLLEPRPIVLDVIEGQYFLHAQSAHLKDVKYLSNDFLLEASNLSKQVDVNPKDLKENEKLEENNEESFYSRFFVVTTADGIEISWRGMVWIFFVLVILILVGIAIGVFLTRRKYKTEILTIGSPKGEFLPGVDLKSENIPALEAPALAHESSSSSASSNNFVNIQASPKPDPTILMSPLQLKFTKKISDPSVLQASEDTLPLNSKNNLRRSKSDFTLRRRMEAPISPANSTSVSPRSRLSTGSPINELKLEALSAPLEIKPIATQLTTKIISVESENSKILSIPSTVISTALSNVISDVPVPVCTKRYVSEFEEGVALGHGGFGSVFMSRNRLDGRDYAIKKVRVSSDPTWVGKLKKVLREVQVLAMMDHENIVRYYQAWLEKVDGSEHLNDVSHEDMSSIGEVSKKVTTPKKQSHKSRFLSKFMAGNKYLDSPLSTGSEADDYYNNDLIEDNKRNKAQKRGSYDYNEGDIMDGFEFDRNGNDELEDEKNEVAFPPSKEDFTTMDGLRDGSYAEDNTVDGDNSLSKSIPMKFHGGPISFDLMLYIQMQYCTQKTLQDFLSNLTREVEVIDIIQKIQQIARGIQHIHQCGIIHRDLKPANLFFVDDKRIKLGDFGLSRNQNPKHNPNDRVTGLKMKRNWSNLSDQSYESKEASPFSMEYTSGMGTYLYSSPEQVNGDVYTEKTDMYSLGMIFFELMHRPFTTTMERIIVMSKARSREYPSGWKENESIADLMMLLEPLLSKLSSERPSAREIAEKCEALLNKKTKQPNVLANITNIPPSDEDSFKIHVVIENRNGIFDELRSVIESFNVKITNFAMYTEESQVLCEFLLKIDNKGDGKESKIDKANLIVDSLVKMIGVLSVE